MRLSNDLIKEAFNMPIIDATVDGTGITVDGEQVIPYPDATPAESCIKAAIWLVADRYGDDTLVPLHVRSPNGTHWFILRGDSAAAEARGPGDLNFLKIKPSTARAYAYPDDLEAIEAGTYPTTTPEPPQETEQAVPIAVIEDETATTPPPLPIIDATDDDPLDNPAPTSAVAPTTAPPDAPGNDDHPLPSPTTASPTTTDDASDAAQDTPEPPQEENHREEPPTPEPTSAPEPEAGPGTPPTDPEDAIALPASHPPQPATPPSSPSTTPHQTPTGPRPTHPTPPAKNRRPKRGTPRRKAIIGGLSTIALLGAGARAAMGNDTPSPTPPPRPTGGTTPLPTKTAPNNLSEQALWSEQIKTDSTPLPLPNGVAVLTPDSKIAIYTEDGTQTSAQDTPSDTKTLYLGSMSNTPAIWTTNGTTISYHTLDGNALAAPVRADVPQGATVSWVGGNPLLTLPGSKAASIDAQGLFTIAVPSGHVATAASDTHILTLDGNARFTRAQRTGDPAQGTLVGQDEATAGPTLIRTVNADLALIAWQAPTGASSLVLADTTTGANKAVLADVDVESLVNASIVAFPAVEAVALGSIVATIGDSPSIAVAEAAPLSCDSAYYYGKSSTSSWVYVPMRDPSSATTITAESPAIPWGGSSTVSYVVDDDGSARKVYALLR